jgi:hypothetical protein
MIRKLIRKREGISLAGILIKNGWKAVMKEKN